MKEGDEPPFINLDRLLNPGFDETERWVSVQTYVRTDTYIYIYGMLYAYTHARTPVLVSR